MTKYYKEGEQLPNGAIKGHKIFLVICHCDQPFLNHGNSALCELLGHNEDEQTVGHRVSRIYYGGARQPIGYEPPAMSHEALRRFLNFLISFDALHSLRDMEAK